MMQIMQDELIHSTNKTFKNKSIKMYGQPHMLAQLHGRVNKAFELPREIKESAQLINSFLYNHSIFAFSFVRHPHERYKNKD